MRNLRSRLLVSATTATLGACILGDLSLEGRPCPCTDGYVCDEASNTCIEESTTQTGPTTGPGSTSATGSTGTAGGSEGGGGAGSGGGPPIGDTFPLVVEGTQQGGLVRLSVDEMFMVEANEANNWMFAHWFDLAVDPFADLAAKPPAYTDTLIDTFQTADFINDWLLSSDGSVASLVVTDETPARFGLRVELDYPLMGLRSGLDQWIYANGRIGYTVWMENVGEPGGIDLYASEYHYATVNPSFSWLQSDVDGNHACLMTRTNGPSPASSFQVVNLGSSTTLEHDSGVNCYWAHGAESMALGESVSYQGALILAPGGIDDIVAIQRSRDLRSPGLNLGEGATAIGSGFDPGQIAYTLSASGPVVQFGLDGALDRFAPAFVIDGWTEPVWEIRRDGAFVASSSTPLGAGAVARHDAETGRLVVVFVESFPQGEAPMFTLSAP